MNLSVGFLYKKIYISYNDTKYEVFEFLDYVAGICFTNAEHLNLINIVTGRNTGDYAYVIDSNKNEGELVFVKDDLYEAIKANDNRVNFADIKEKRISTKSKYYLRTEKGTGLNKLVNSDLINFVETEKRNRNNDFDEEEFEHATDISTIYKAIKKTILSQDEQIMKILTALFKNKTLAESDWDIDLILKQKEHVLIYGETGTGKTEIVKRIAKLFDIPIVIEDATLLSETGYQGRKITDMLQSLYFSANGDIERAQKGVLVIDEFDKLAEKARDSQTHVSRLGVQISLLKLLDGIEYYFDGKKFDTTKLTVVALGAFTGIREDNDYTKVTTKDFINYGIEKELIGRFSKIVRMNSLAKEDIVKILKSSNFSPVNTYKKFFELLGVDYEYSDDFIEYIAEKSCSFNTGARGIKTIFDEEISGALFRIFAGEYSGISLVKPENIGDKAYVLTKKVK